MDRAAVHTLIEKIEGRVIVVEGMPGVGKATLLRSLSYHLRAFGASPIVHDESPDAALFKAFMATPRTYAFTFQMYKLMRRQHVLERLALRHHTGDARSVHLVSRSLAGDMAFALYSHVVGNIADDDFKTYMNEATASDYEKPFLVIYLTAPPAKLIERIARRGNRDETKTYTETYYKHMAQCYDMAMKTTCCDCARVDWSTDLALDHREGSARKILPAALCFALLQKAIDAASFMADNE